MTISLASLGGGVKNVQRGSTDINAVASTTATITEVDLTKSVLIINQSTNTNSMTSLAKAELTNATTITFSKGGAVGVTTVNWQVVEYS